MSCHVVLPCLLTPLPYLPFSSSGASTKWREEIASQRKDFRNTNYNLDIQGAQHDTIKHSITSTRNTHPLQPVYQSLDGSGEVLEPCIQPLIPMTMVQSTTIRTMKLSQSIMQGDTGGFSLSHGNEINTSAKRGGMSTPLTPTQTQGRALPPQSPSNNAPAANVFNAFGTNGSSMGFGSGRGTGVMPFSPKPATASASGPSSSLSFATKFNDADVSAGAQGSFGEKSTLVYWSI